MLKMKKLILAGAVMCASASAFAADFSDREDKEFTLSFARNLNKVTVDLVQVQDLYAGQGIQGGTKIATLNISSVRAARLGFRWSSEKTYQSIQGAGDIVQVNHITAPGKFVTLQFKSTPGVSPVTVGTDTYYVSDQAGTLAQDVVLAATQDIEVGDYKVAIDAAVYNP